MIGTENASLPFGGSLGLLCLALVSLGLSESFRQ